MFSSGHAEHELCDILSRNVQVGCVCVHTQIYAYLCTCIFMASSRDDVIGHAQREENTSQINIKISAFKHR